MIPDEHVQSAMNAMADEFIRSSNFSNHISVYFALAGGGYRVYLQHDGETVVDFTPYAHFNIQTWLAYMSRISPQMSRIKLELSKRDEQYRVIITEWHPS